MNFFKKYAFIKIILLLTLLASMILGTYLHGVFEKIENKYKMDAVKHNELQYNIIKKNLLNTKKDIHYISSLYKYFNDNVLHDKEKGLEDFTQSLIRLMETRKVYSQARFIDHDGFEVVRVDYKNLKATTADKAKLQNKSDRYYFKESLSLNNGEIAVSKFDLNIENGKIEKPYKPTIRLSTPVVDKNGVIVGYVIINYSGEEILNELELFSTEIGSLLLNTDSYYLLGFTPSDEWAFMFGKNTSFKNSYPDIWNKCKKEKTFFIKQNGIQFTFHTVNHVGMVSPNRKTKAKRHWTIVSYVSDEVVWKSFYVFLDSVKILMLVFGLIILLFSYLISMYMRKINESNLRIEIANEVFKNTMDGILVLNPEGHIIQVNRAFTVISGYSEHEVLGENPRLLSGIYGESKEFYKNLWETVIKDGYWQGEVTNQNKDSSKYISHLSIGVVKQDKEILYYIGVFADVTKQREDKEKLISSTKALEKSLEDLKKAQNKLIESEKLTALGQLIAGVSHEINSPLGAIKSSSDNVLESINKVIANVPKLDSLLSDRDKELFEKLKSNIPLEISVLSIKEQRSLKKKLIEQLDSMGITKSRYFADKFSQFNVENIAEYKELIMHENADFIVDTLFDEYLTISNMYNIKRSVDRASKTIYALKKFAHFDHDREGVVEKLEDSINSILVLFSHNLKQGIEVIKNYKSLESIFCYSDELSQVWMNIISNAIHAMNSSGRLEISIYEDSNYQIVSIKDSGSGIPKELQEKIFDPFFTTKKSGEGSGLGLDIVKKIVEAHNGKIELQSDENGTMFTIYISKNLKGEHR